MTASNQKNNELQGMTLMVIVIIMFKVDITKRGDMIVF